MAVEQLDLFTDNSEISLVKRDLRDLKGQMNNVRKGIFSRYSQLEKMFFELKEEIQKLNEDL